MGYWKYYGWRWILIALVGWWGWTDSGWEGVFWAEVLLGFTLFVIYTMMEAWGKLTGAFKRESYYYDQRVANIEHLHVEKDAMRGQPHPDPTRPTTDDYMAMIENYRHRKGS